MIFSIIQLSQALNHHRHLALTVASSFTAGETLPGKYCALSTITDGNIVDTPGVSIPLTVDGLNTATKNLCIGGYSLKDTNKPELQWLFFNVPLKAAADGKTQVKQVFAQGKSFADYGEPKTLETEYQTSKKAKAGYLGPIGRRFQPSAVGGEEIKYEVRVFEQTKVITSTAATGAVADCGTTFGAFAFKSKFGEMILAVLVFVAMLL